MSRVKAFAVALGIATAVGASSCVSAQDVSHGASAPDVVVLPFAVLGHDDADAQPLNACAGQAAAPKQSDAAALDAAAASGLPAALTSAVAQTLAGQDGAQVHEHLDDAPAGALIVVGCVQRADPGNAAERLIGMNLGASELAAHIQVYRRDQSQFQLLREFDVGVTGANKLPPLGPAGLVVHGIRGMHETLAADVTKLSKQIATRVQAS